MREHRYFVYMLTNTVRRPIYTGVSNSITRRQPEHKEKVDPGSYTAKYNLNRLLYVEQFQYIDNAIDREKQVKPWSRKKKIALIESVNPKWDDLSRDWGEPIKNLDPSTPVAPATSARDDNSIVIRLKPRPGKRKTFGTSLSKRSG
jgi:putative endonuclease